MDKAVLKTLKPGDKFTIELTVQCVSDRYVRTTACDTVIFEAASDDSIVLRYDLVSVERKPEPIKVGDMVCRAEWPNAGNFKVLAELDDYYVFAHEDRKKPSISMYTKDHYVKSA